MHYLSAESRHSEGALRPHKGTLFRIDEPELETREQEVPQKGQLYKKQFSSDALLYDGEYMVVDDVGLGVGSVRLRSEIIMEMLEQDIKELRRTNIIDGVDAEGVARFF